MNPCGSTSAHSLLIPAPVHQILWLHWVATTADLTKTMKILDFYGAPNPQSEAIPEWIQGVVEHNGELGRLIFRIDRIKNYLGLKANSRDTDSVESFDWEFAARWVRGMVQNGASDEEIAAHLKRSIGDVSKGRRSGRPSGTMNHDGIALRALEIHDSNPKFWTWPKLADRIFADCKAHPKHTSDDSCTLKLKQAVTRLRAFIRELESVRSHSEIQSAIRDINPAPIVVT